MPLGRRVDSQVTREIHHEPTSCTPAQNTQITPINSTEKSDNPEKKLSASVLLQVEEPKCSFDDIVLNKSTSDAIQDVLAIYTEHDRLFNQWGLGETHRNQNRVGINLYGPSGTGKTMAAHGIAKQLGRKILTVDYSQIESKYVGETSKNLVSMFDYAKESNSVIFFDEADALLSKRVTNMSNSTDVSVNQTRSVLLLLINDFDDLILFATNFITNYDPAFMRRILGHIRFSLPEKNERAKIWRIYIPEKLPTNVDVDKLAGKYDGVSGSDISSAVLAASLRTARLNEEIVEHVYFEEAIERILKSKLDNDCSGEIISKRTVSEDYVKTQFGGDLPK